MIKQNNNQLRGSVIVDNIATGDIKMSLDEYSRWLSLIEAISLVCDKASNLKIDTENSDAWIKPIPLTKYVEERCDLLKEELVYRDDVKAHRITVDPTSDSKPMQSVESVMA